MARKSLTKSELKSAIQRLKKGGVVASGVDGGSANGTKTKSHGAGSRVSEALTTHGKVVAVRLSAEETDALDRMIAKVGASSRSDAIRSLIRASVGMLEFPPEDAARLGEIKTELHKIGVNINQIALAANRGRIDMARQEWDAINDVRQALPKVRTWLNAVVDEQRRRGIRLYRAFVEAGNV